jgi:hypothetical protein
VESGKRYTLDERLGSMLEISPTATEAIQQITDTVPGVEGIRFTLDRSASSNGDGPSGKLVIGLASGPADGERTLKRDGVVVFAEYEVVPLLDDKVLDVTAAGAGNFRFTLAEQDA